MRWAIVLLLVPLAGCFDAPVPDDAIETRSPDMPGLKLTTWVLEEGGRLRMHALVENLGSESYDIRIGCGHPWDSRITGPDGDVHFREVAEESGCAAFWDVLRPKATMDTLYSWDYQDHDLEAGTSTPVPAGDYTWVLRFNLRDDRFLESRIPITISALDDFSIELDGDGPSVHVTVRNNGDTSPTFWTGCMTEWDVEIYHEGQPVPREPMFTCQGFEETTFPPGHVINGTFTWDGKAWDADSESTYDAEPGMYEWRISFGLQGTSGPVITGTLPFELQ